ncbi:hypothetical protein PanWU01x14_075600 [Parasponia andersonii]|uniref:Uncharacterized protein n=1 Tax=Parasponia andersonii TaxID=3476 RepID=A0A2P5DCV5_PARAD|nr:hypothetical protein PanWU01x14_075600 [Parasponia andersonii]
MSHIFLTFPVLNRSVMSNPHIYFLVMYHFMSS